MINRALLGVATTSSPSDELTLDQLLAEPIVQQLMRRDSIDEATIRQLLQETASARLASRAEDDQYSDEEAERRMNAALRRALNTRPHPQATVRHPRSKKAKTPGADRPAPKRGGGAHA